jgi:ATP-dependent exoDNAse (exonuclease V) beta subunit
MTLDVVQPSLLDVDDDAATRRAIVTDLDQNLFVEAGAGSGKTHALVSRVIALVTTAGVPMREIAVVTFTEKAAAELRERVRAGLLEVAAGAVPEPAVAAATDALDELDAAAGGVTHARRLRNGRCGLASSGLQALQGVTLGGVA